MATCCKSECREDCYVYDDEIGDWSDVMKHGGCCSPFVFHCSLNPFECFRFCLPCLACWKVFVNVVVFIVIVIAVTIYALITGGDKSYY